MSNAFSRSHELLALIKHDVIKTYWEVNNISKLGF